MRDDQRRAMHAKKSKPAKPGKVPLGRIDPGRILKNATARELAADPHADLGGWLDTASTAAEAVTALGLAMEDAYYAPEDERDFQEITRQILKWADLPAPPENPAVVKEWTKRLQDNQEALESAIFKASANYEWVTEANAATIAGKVHDLLPHADPATIERYLRKHHVTPARERLADERRGHSWGKF